MNRDMRIKRQKEFLIQAAYWLIWICVAVGLIKCAGSVLLPFVAAFAVAWGLSRPVDYIAEKLHFNRGFVSVVIVVLFYLLIAAGIYLLGSRVIALVQEFYTEITYFWSGTMIPMIRACCGWLNGVWQTADITAAEAVNQAGEMLSGVSVKVINGVSDMAFNIPSVCMNILIAVIATVFTELEFHEIRDFLRRQIPKRWQKAVAEIQGYTVEMLRKCVFSYAFICAMTYAELAAGFLLLRIDGAFTIALIIALLDILPVLGTGTVLLPWMIIAIASGNLRVGIGLLVLYLVITVVRNIVEPRLVGSQMGLSPVVMLPCMILGLHFFGILGLFFVPYGVAFVKSLNDRGIIHIFKTKAS